MTSRYPVQIDSALNLPLVVDNFTPVTGGAVNRLREAIINVEAELGVKPSGLHGTVKARLDAIESAISSGGGGGGGGGSGSGIRVVADIAERDAILSSERSEAMLVYVLNNGTGPAYYQLGAGLSNSDWSVANFVHYSNNLVSASLTTGPIVATSFESALATINGKIIANGIDTSTLSDSDQGIIYYDLSENKFKVSQNGGAYVDLLGGGSGIPGGSDTQIQFNDAGSFGGDAGLTYDKTTNVLTVQDAIAVGSSPAGAGNIRLPAMGTIYGVAAGPSDARLLRFNASGSGYDLHIGEGSLVGTIILETTSAPGGGFSVQGTGSERMFIGKSSSDHIDLGATPATTGAIRLTNGTAIKIRNVGNSADIHMIGINGSSNGIDIGDSNTGTVKILPATDVWLGSSSGTSLIANSTSVTLWQGVLNTASSATAATGNIRMANTQTIRARNASNGADLNLISSGPADEIVIGDTTAVSSIEIKTNGALYQRVGGLVVQDAGATVNRLWLSGNSTDLIAFGATPATTGLIRAPWNGGVLQPIINIKDGVGADFNLLGITTNHVTLASPAGGSVALDGSGNVNLITTTASVALYAGGGHDFYNYTKAGYVANANQHGWQFGGGGVDFGGGSQVIGIDNATTNPTTNPTNGIVAYVDAGDGYLKYRKADGTVINLDGGSGSPSSGPSVQIFYTRVGNSALWPSGDATTNSNTFSSLLELNNFVLDATSTLEILFTFSGRVGGEGPSVAYGEFKLDLDSVDISGGCTFYQGVPNANILEPQLGSGNLMRIVTSVSAGTHSVRVRWKCGGPAATRDLSILENTFSEADHGSLSIKAIPE